MKTIEILDNFYLPRTVKNYTKWVKNCIIEEGEKPIKAKYDSGGNCLICGEAGRCPGWHTADDIQN